MNVAWQILWFIVAVGLLVTVHEFGHYWVARRLGFKVLRFSVGFGKPLWKKVAGADRTEYVVAALPLGGYVKMLDEREGPVDPAELHRSFTRKPPWQRIVVLLAGPAFNIAFAILVLWGMFWVNGTHRAAGRRRRGDARLACGALPGSLLAMRSSRLNGSTVTGQSDVVFGLLDAMSTDGSATLVLKSSEGDTRTARIEIADAQQRLKLTEPAELFRGLGFEFWEPFALPQLGEVTQRRPGGQGRPSERATSSCPSMTRPASFRHLSEPIASACRREPVDPLSPRRARAEPARHADRRRRWMARRVGRIQVEYRRAGGREISREHAPAHRPRPGERAPGRNGEGLGHDCTAGTAGVADAHRQRLVQESERPAVDRRIRRRVGHATASTRSSAFWC